MKNVLAGLGVMLVALVNQPAAWAVESENGVFRDVLQDLGKTAPNDFQQISEAVEASEFLQHELNELISAKRFDGFSIAPRSQLEGYKAGMFGGFAQGSRIVLATEYLQALKPSRLFDVVYADDVLPDNTVFAIAHLLYHLRLPLDPRAYPSRSAFTEAALRSEAMAFIQGWNAVLQAAERKNGGKLLSPRQQGQLLMNTRYRFAFIGAMNGENDALDFSPTGVLEASERNVMAIATALRNAAHADIE